MDTGPPSTSGRTPQASSEAAGSGDGQGFSGVYTLAAVAVALYVLKLDLATDFVKRLFLNHGQPQAWQFVTAGLCTTSWEQLSTVSFLLYVFGRIIERSQGWFGVWAAYLCSGLGASIARYLWLPHKVGKLVLLTPGAVSAAFGVFVASVLLRPSLSWRRVMEVLLIGQFVTRVALSDSSVSAAALPLVGVLGQRVPPQCVDLAGAALGAGAFCLAAALKDAVGALLERGDDDKRQPGSKRGRHRG